jgi:hypothetical protein
MPQVPEYDIVAPETITLSLPAAAMRGAATGIPNAASFVVLAARGTAELGGSVLQSLSETDVMSRSTTIDVLLHHDTFNNQTAAMCVNGLQAVLSLEVAPLDSEWCWPLPPWPNPQAPPPPPSGTLRCERQQERGWASVLRDLPCSGLTLVDNRRLRLTVPPFAEYDIITAETIRVTVNGFSLTSNRSTLARPAFDVHPIPGNAICSGTFVGANESGVRAGGLILDVTLDGSKWRPNLEASARRAVARARPTGSLTTTRQRGPGSRPALTNRPGGAHVATCLPKAEGIPKLALAASPITSGRPPLAPASSERNAVAGTNRL